MFSFLLKWFSPKVSAEKSELSNPDIHKVPYGFFASHYRVLEYMDRYMYTEENKLDVSWMFIRFYEKSADKRASELWRMWFLNVRVEKFPLPQGGTGKRNYYSINKKGKEAILNFNHKF